MPNEAIDDAIYFSILDSWFNLYAAFVFNSILSVYAFCISIQFQFYCHQLVVFIISRFTIKLQKKIFFLFLLAA